MTTTLTETEESRARVDNIRRQLLLLEDDSWNFYKRFLRETDLNRFLNMLPSEPETLVLRRFRDWVRQSI